MNRRRPRFTSPLASMRDAALQVILRPFRGLSPTVQFVIGFGFLVVLTTLLLLRPSATNTPDVYKEGDVVRSNIIAPADVPGGIDTAETERRRNLARNAVRPIFRFDSREAETAARNFREAWNGLKTQSERATPNRSKLVWPGEGGDAVVSAIVGHQFSPRDLDTLAGIVRGAGEGYVYDDSDSEQLKQEILLVDVRNSGSQTIMPMPLTRMTPVSSARSNVLSELSRLKGWTREQQATLAAAITPLVKANVVFDQRATEAAREEEANRIPPVLISIKRNQIVAREGDMVTQTMLAELALVRAYGKKGRPFQSLLGLTVLVAAIYAVAWKFTEHRGATVSLSLSSKRAFALVSSAVVVQTIIMRLGFVFSDGIASQSEQAPFNDATIWHFAIPFAAAALLVCLLVDTQLALITGLITALFAGLVAPTGMETAMYAMISCAAAIYGIGRYRERQSVTLAGLFAGAVNAVTALALIAYAQDALTWRTVFLALACGVASGLLTTIFTAGGLPINESLFGILTDVKLLELSNADLPALGQLALRAPGTNQHSHAVGQLAEEACRAVGANPLLARIGALYHDIGKVAAPDYFVENQHDRNPHDRLKPSQSARIITSHVTYGLRLAKEIGLPKRVADFITQHHGTRTLHFFLRKAQADAKAGEEVDEAEFRYPGPKPQFKETAIMMLADSCEAAARSLARPDPESIRAIVVKILDAVISDGQLDECDLTLRELTTIRESIISALIAIYHARIDYPGFNPPPPVTGALPSAPTNAHEPEKRGVTYGTPSEIPINQGGEVEDEAISRKPVKSAAQDNH